MKENGANDSTYGLIFELLWRDFFRFMFKKYQTKFSYMGIKGEKKTHNRNKLFHSGKMVQLLILLMLI
jgi:deoxyribodipyrimidine photo-lyase